MRLIKRMLMGIGATAMVGLLATLVAPKAVHGAVAALVQVANTTAAPALTLDISRSASQSVTLFCSANQCVNNTSNGAYVVPVGQNLVATSLDIVGFSSPKSSPTQFFELTPGGVTNPDQGGAFVVLGDGITHEFLIPSGIVFPAGTVLDSTHIQDSDVTAVAVFLHGFLSPI
jgi:hypothetical protein